MLGMNWSLVMLVLHQLKVFLESEAVGEN
jgi:hypothetical protein